MLLETFLFIVIYYNNDKSLYKGGFLNENQMYYNF